MSVVHVTDADFQSEVLDQKDKVVLVDFYADWCGPCKAMAPTLDLLAEERTDVLVKKINVDQNPGSAAKYGIRGIPTIIFFKDGETKSTLVGLQNKDDLNGAIDKI